MHQEKQTVPWSRFMRQGSHSRNPADSDFRIIRFLEVGAEPRHREGDSVHLHVSPASALLFDKASGRRIDARIAA